MQTELAQVYVHGIGHALAQETNQPSKADQVASAMQRRAESVIGTPPPTQARGIERTVEGLVEGAPGAKEDLDKVDKRAGDLEKVNARVRSDQEDIRADRDRLMSRLAAEAETWRRIKLWCSISAGLLTAGMLAWFVVKHAALIARIAAKVGI